MALALETQSSIDRIARQELRSAVNFGVASLARVLGMVPSELLELRCECGRAACAALVRISLRDYQAAELESALLVVSGNILGRTQTATLYIHDGIESNLAFHWVWGDAAKTDAATRNAPRIRPVRDIRRERANEHPRPVRIPSSIVARRRRL